MPVKKARLTDPVRSDQLDNYQYAADPAERGVVASVLWLDAAGVALAFAGRWISTGKWLLRELKEFRSRLRRLDGRREDPVPLAATVLARAGGPLFDGYRAQAPD